MFSNENSEIESNNLTLDDWELNVTSEFDRSLSMISAMKSEEKHTMNDVNLMQQIGPPKIKYGLKCHKHKDQIIHSYLLETVCPKDLDYFEHTLLCSECIFEKGLKEQ